MFIEWPNQLVKYLTITPIDDDGIRTIATSDRQQIAFYSRKLLLTWIR